MFDEAVFEGLVAMVPRLDDANASTVAEAVALGARMQASLDAYHLLVANRTAVLHAAGQSESPESMLARHGRQSVRHGRRVARRAAATAKTPKLRDALSNGSISSGHADALATASGRLTDEQKEQLFDHDEDLATKASQMSPERFGEHLRNLADAIIGDEGASEFEDQRKQTKLTKYVDPRTGMYHLNAMLDPESGAVLFKAIDDQTRGMVYAKSTADLGGVVESKRTEWEHVAAHALVALVRGGKARTSGVQAEMVIVIDADTVMHGAHEHTHCATSDGDPLAVASARRLLCTAIQHLAITDMHGQVLELGTTTAIPNRAMRRSLQAMYSTCAFDGCDTPFTRCEIHHVRFRHLGGPTDIDNLLPLCIRHHHQVHEGRWRLELTPDRTVRLWRPDGVHHRDIPLQPVVRPKGERARGRPDSPLAA